MDARNSFPQVGSVVEELDLDLASEMVAVQAAAKQVIANLKERGVADRDIFHVRLALDEALANAVKHGNRMDPSKQIHLRCVIHDQRVEITIEDEGEGFDLTSVPDPMQKENLTKPGGRGLLLMRSFMTDIRYNLAGNCVTLVKAY